MQSSNFSTRVGCVERGKAYRLRVRNVVIPRSHGLSGSQELRERALSSAEEEVEAARVRMEERKLRYPRPVSLACLRLFEGCIMTLFHACLNHRSRMSLTASDSPRVAATSAQSAATAATRTASAASQPRFSFSDRPVEHNPDGHADALVEAAVLAGT